MMKQSTTSNSSGGGGGGGGGGIEGGGGGRSTAPVYEACWGRFHDAIVKGKVEVCSQLLTASTCKEVDSCLGSLSPGERLRHLDAIAFSKLKTTSLHMASLYRRPDLVELLLRHGADPTAMDGFGRTPGAVLLEHWPRIILPSPPSLPTSSPYPSLPDPLDRAHSSDTLLQLLAGRDDNFINSPNPYATGVGGGGGREMELFRQQVNTWRARSARCLRLLLAHGLKVSEVSDRRRASSLLHIAARYDLVDVIELVVGLSRETATTTTITSTTATATATSTTTTTTTTTNRPRADQAPCSTRQNDVSQTVPSWTSKHNLASANAALREIGLEVTDDADFNDVKAEAVAGSLTVANADTNADVGKLQFEECDDADTHTNDVVLETVACTDTNTDVIKLQYDTTDDATTNDVLSEAVGCTDTSADFSKYQYDTTDDAATHSNDVKSKPVANTSFSSSLHGQEVASANLDVFNALQNIDDKSETGAGAEINSCIEGEWHPSDVTSMTVDGRGNLDDRGKQDGKSTQEGTPTQVGTTSQDGTAKQDVRGIATQDRTAKQDGTATKDGKDGTQDPTVIIPVPIHNDVNTQTQGAPVTLSCPLCANPSPFQPHRASNDDDERHAEEPEAQTSRDTVPGSDVTALTRVTLAVGRQARAVLGEWRHHHCRGLGMGRQTRKNRLCQHAKEYQRHLELHQAEQQLEVEQQQQPRRRRRQQQLLIQQSLDGPSSDATTSDALPTLGPAAECDTEDGRPGTTRRRNTQANSSVRRNSERGAGGSIGEDGFSRIRSGTQALPRVTEEGVGIMEEERNDHEDCTSSSAEYKRRSEMRDGCKYYCSEAATTRLDDQNESVDLEVRNGTGKTPLLVAVDRGSLHAAHCLLSHGADVLATDLYGRSILHLLAERDSTFDLLLHDVVRRGVPVSAVDHGGNTALHVASYMGQDSKIRFLVAAGASPDVTNMAGRSPLFLSLQRRDAGTRDTVLLYLLTSLEVKVRDRQSRLPFLLESEYNAECLQRLDQLRKEDTLFRRCVLVVRRCVGVVRLLHMSHSELLALPCPGAVHRVIYGEEERSIVEDLSM